MCVCVCVCVCGAVWDSRHRKCQNDPSGSRFRGFISSPLVSSPFVPSHFRFRGINYVPSRSPLKLLVGVITICPIEMHDNPPCNTFFKTLAPDNHILFWPLGNLLYTLAVSPLWTIVKCAPLSLPHLHLFTSPGAFHCFSQCVPDPRVIFLVSSALFPVFLRAPCAPTVLQSSFSFFFPLLV